MEKFRVPSLLILDKQQTTQKDHNFMLKCKQTKPNVFKNWKFFVRNVLQQQRQQQHKGFRFILMNYKKKIFRRTPIRNASHYHTSRSYRIYIYDILFTSNHMMHFMIISSNQPSLVNTSYSYLAGWLRSYGVLIMSCLTHFTYRLHRKLCVGRQSVHISIGCLLVRLFFPISVTFVILTGSLEKKRRSIH